MHFPWPYAHTTPPPLPTTQPQPTWPLPQPSTAPTFPTTQPSAYPHPQPQPFQPQPVLSTPTATALTYGTPSTWAFVPPCHVPPQPTQPAPVFPTAAPPPSYLIPPHHPTPPAELPPPTTLPHPSLTQQQTAIANYPSTDPQCAIPQGVWQPYSAFPPVTQHPLQPDPHHRLHTLPLPQRQPNLHFNSSYHRIQHHRSNPPPGLPRTIHYQSKTHRPPYPNIQHPPRWSLPHQHRDLQSQHQTNLTPLPHQRHNHLPHNHHTAVAATITRADASPTITTEDATATAADIAITTIPNTTAKPGDGARLPHPPTHLASHQPAVDPHHHPLIYAQTPNTQTLIPLNIPPQPSSVAHSTVGDLHSIFTPSDQILEWLEFHATQLDNPNRPQHQYIANILTDCNISYKEINDFRQYTHTKWNDTTHQYDQFQYFAISLPFLNTKATTPEPPAVSRATSTHREVAHINAGHTGPVGNISNILRQGRFLPSTLHFANYPGFFAQGVRITHNQPHDHNELARIIHNTWQLHKNSHSLIITLLAWGAATKYTSGGEEQAMNLLNDHHGAVFHQKGRCWVIHPDHAIVKGLAWSTNSTPPDP